MKRIRVAVILLLFVSAGPLFITDAAGQSAIIRGTVSDEASGEPMAGVNVTQIGRPV